MKNDVCLNAKGTKKHFVGPNFFFHFSFALLPCATYAVVGNPDPQGAADMIRDVFGHMGMDD